MYESKCDLKKRWLLETQMTPNSKLILTVQEFLKQ